MKQLSLLFSKRKHLRPPKSYGAWPNIYSDFHRRTRIWNRQLVHSLWTLPLFSAVMAATKTLRHNSCFQHTHCLAGEAVSWLHGPRSYFTQTLVLALKASVISCTLRELTSTWILRGLLGRRKRDYVVTEAGKRGIRSLYVKDRYRHKPLTGFQVSCSFQGEVWKGSRHREICPRIISCRRDSNPGDRDVCHVWGWLFSLLSVRSTFVGTWIKFRGVAGYHFVRVAPVDVVSGDMLFRTSFVLQRRAFEFPSDSNLHVCLSAHCTWKTGWRLKTWRGNIFNTLQARRNQVRSLAGVHCRL